MENSPIKRIKPYLPLASDDKEPRIQPVLPSTETDGGERAGEPYAHQISPLITQRELPEPAIPAPGLTPRYEYPTGIEPVIGSQQTPPPTPQNITAPTSQTDYNTINQEEIRMPNVVNTNASQTFKAIDVMATTNTVLATQLANKAWETISKAETDIKAMLEKQGMGLDPFTAAMLKELKTQSEDERNKVIAMYRQKGIMRGGMLAKEIQRFQQNVTTTQERMLSELATKNQERLHSVLMQFATQRSNMAMWEGELSMKAQEMDISQYQWNLARQDANSRWNAEMAWDKEKWTNEFQESLRRFGIDQDRLERLFTFEKKKWDEQLGWEQSKLAQELGWDKEKYYKSLEQDLYKFTTQLGWDKEQYTLGIEHDLYKYNKTYTLQEREFEWKKLYDEKTLTFNYDELRERTSLSERELNQSLMLTIKKLEMEDKQFNISSEKDWMKFLYNYENELARIGLDKEQIKIARDTLDLNKSRFQEDIRQFNETLKFQKDTSAGTGSDGIAYSEHATKSFIRELTSYKTFEEAFANYGVMVNNGMLKGVDINQLFKAINEKYPEMSSSQITEKLVLGDVKYKPQIESIKTVEDYARITRSELDKAEKDKYKAGMQMYGYKGDKNSIEYALLKKNHAEATSKITSLNITLTKYMNEISSKRLDTVNSFYKARQQYSTSKP